MKTPYILFLITLTLHSYTNAQQCNETFTGEGTFYGYAGGGNCSFANPELPAYTCAMNQAQYDTSATCGACVRVSGPIGTVDLRIEDQCPECKHGDIDLSEVAFPLVAIKADGRVNIAWNFIPCKTDGPIQFYFKEGSSQWWTAVQIRNHRYPIESVEYFDGTNWIDMERRAYNYFLVESGLGEGPYDFRITDMYDNVLEEYGVAFAETTIIEGTQQFPVCSDHLLTQTICFEAGWNMFSLYVAPDVPFLETVTSSSTISTVKDADSFYLNDQPLFLNSLKETLPKTAYMAYALTDTCINVDGIDEFARFQYPENTGWNIYAVAVDVASNDFFSIHPNCSLIKDFDAFRTITGDGTLDTLRRGKAYFVFMEE